MSSSIVRRRPAAVAVGVLALAAGATTSALAGGTEPATSGPVPVKQWRTAAAYSALNSADAPRASSDAPAYTNKPLNATLAKAIRLPAGDSSTSKVAAYIGADGPCLVEYDAAGAGQGCVGPDSPMPPTLSTPQPGGGEAVVGLAPDNVNRVTVTSADGSTREVPVSENVYRFTTDRPLADDAIAIPGFEKGE